MEIFAAYDPDEIRDLFFEGMKTCLRASWLLVFTLAWLLAGLRTEAQGFGILNITPPAPVAVNGTLVYTFSVTNETGFNLTDFAVTNTFSSNFNFLTATNDHFTNVLVIATNANSIVYAFDLFNSNDVVNFSYSIQPLTTGFLTNTIQVTTTALTNTATTNIVTQVFTAVSDLGVTVLGPAQAVITNDITSYRVVYTNLGSGSVPNVVLTNTFPPGTILKSISPSQPGFSLSGSNMLFNLGTLASGAGGSFLLTIQPTNVEVAALSASIGAPGLLDNNPTNNFFTTNVPFSGYLLGTLTVVTNSLQKLNIQNGLTEQSIVVSNAGTVDVQAVRVVVTGLTNQLVNAVGTNNGSPFVYLSSRLVVGQSANMLLQYFVPTRAGFPFTNSQLHAFAVTTPVWTPPTATSTSTNINLRHIIEMTNGDVLLEFPATAGLSYSIIYSDNVLFSNAMVAPPAIIAPGNAVQWIDYGPPTTMSAPASVPTRFYRVLQNP